MVQIKVDFKETDNVKRFVRFVKADITENDVVTEDFLKSEIDEAYAFMVSRGRIQEMTVGELFCATIKLFNFYDIKLFNFDKTMKFNIVTKD